MTAIVRFSTRRPTEEAADPPADRIAGGVPRARVLSHYESPDGRFLAGVWTCTPGRWRIRYDEHEYFRVLSGRGAVIDVAGHVTDLLPGEDYAIAPGFVGEWEVLETMTKTYVIALPEG